MIIWYWSILVLMRKCTTSVISIRLLAYFKNGKIFDEPIEVLNVFRCLFNISDFKERMANRQKGPLIYMSFLCICFVCAVYNLVYTSSMSWQPNIRHVCCLLTIWSASHCLSLATLFRQAQELCIRELIFSSVRYFPQQFVYIFLDIWCG